MRRLKEEAKKPPPQQDNFFKLNAARFLWTRGTWFKRVEIEASNANWDEVPDILAIWEGARLSYHLHYPFYTAIEAAGTQDPRAVPLMRALLKEHDGVVHTTHMPIAWPDTDEFIWGVYGPQGLPVLLDVLRTTQDPREKMSAMHLLGDGQYLAALPLVRQCAQDPDRDVRAVALMTLGHYGHPEDFALLASGLGGDDTQLVQSHIAGLRNYGDLRAVPLLIPFLDSENASVREEAIRALGRLLNPAALEALRGHAKKPNLPAKEVEHCTQLVDGVLKRLDLTWDSYAAKEPAERESLLRRLRAQRWSLGPNEPAMSHQQFLQAARQWKAWHRLGKPLDASIRAKHLVAAATPADIGLLQEVRAAVLMRLSDEAYYEAHEIDLAVEYLGRSRYRKDPAVTEKAEPRE